MSNRNNVVLEKHLDSLAAAISAEITIHSGSGGGSGTSYSDFTGATNASHGSNGLVPAPLVGEQNKYLSGDGSWKNPLVENVFTGATSVSAGTAGFVPSPSPGAENYFLRGDGTWASIAGGDNSQAYILSDHISSIEGGVWAEEIDNTPYLRLRHGDYIYNFAHDVVTYVGGGNSAVATVTPNTYFLGTTPVNVDGGLWYETDDIAKLKYHSGHFIYSLNPDSMTYKGNNAELVAYLPLDSSPTADALGNTWTAYGNPTVTSGGTSFDGSSCLANSTISAAIGSSPWTVDFWANSRNTRTLTFFGTFNALYATSGSVTNSWVVLAWDGGNVCLDRCSNDVNISAGLQPDTRHHFALTYDGTSLRVFIDGVLKQTTEWAVTLGGDFVIGARGGRSIYYNGILDHFRIWNKALWTYDFTPPTAEDYT